MTRPDAKTLYDVIGATWPAADQRDVGPWTVRFGKASGSRTSAATARQAVRPNDLPQAEDAMRALGQTPLFMIRAGDDALDAMLQDAGYAIKDPVTMYAIAVAQLTQKRPPPVTSFAVWPPLATQREIWAAGGIGAGRLAVMDRAPTPKTTLLGRINDRPAGTAFVGAAHGCAMIHALEIAPEHRRHGLARNLTIAAAFWAQKQQLDWLTLVTTTANEAANALYASLGMQVVGQYHYRIHPEA